MKNHLLYCLDQAINQFHLQPPFLDAGCGIGDVSRHLAQKNWTGKALDLAPEALEQAHDILRTYPNVILKNGSLFDENETFNTIILWDVIEHINDGQAVLNKLSTLLKPSGHLVISVPSNPREWRWDDEYYGHVKRYTPEEFGVMLRQAHLNPVVFWDFTFPLFWALRRIYTFIKSPPIIVGSAETRTLNSSLANAWDIPVLSPLLNSTHFIWKIPLWVQFTLFRTFIEQGHGMFVLAQKTT